MHPQKNIKVSAQALFASNILKSAHYPKFPNRAPPNKLTTDSAHSQRAGPETIFMCGDIKSVWYNIH